MQSMISLELITMYVHYLDDEHAPEHLIGRSLLDPLSQVGLRAEDQAGQLVGG